MIFQRRQSLRTQLELAMARAVRAEEAAAGADAPFQKQTIALLVAKTEADAAELAYARSTIVDLQAKLAGQPFGPETSGEELSRKHPVHNSCANAASRVCPGCRPHLGYTHPVVAR